MGVDEVAAEQQLLGPLGPDETSEPLRSAGTGHSPDPGARYSELRASAGNPYIAAQRQLQAARQAKPVDGGHDRLADRLDAAVSAPEVLQPFSNLRNRLDLETLLQIAPGGKHLVISRENDAAYLGVLVQFSQL